MQLRQKKLKDISRWAKFRVERQEVIDRYIKVRKKQYKAEMLIKLIILRKYVKTEFNNFSSRLRTLRARK